VSSGQISTKNEKILVGDWNFIFFTATFLFFLVLKEITLKKINMKKFYSLLAFIALFNMSSCTSDDNLLNHETQNSVDLYVLGQKNGQTCYWKNNQVVTLNQGNFVTSDPNKIIVSNNNVHILGNSTDVDLYWNNGTLTNLTSTFSDNTQVVKGIWDMEVVGNDVYFVGFTKNPLVTAEIYDLAYWKNGQKTIIAANINSIPESSIAVANNTVYVTSKSNLSDPKYYINGVSTSLPNGTQISELTKKGNSVYIYGNKGNNGFYKNLTTNIETLFPTPHLITNLIFDGNDVYHFTADEFYKNTVVTPLNIQPVNGQTSYLLPFQKAIVLNGNIYSIQNCSPMFSAGFSMVGINGVNVFESNSTNEVGFFTDLFVVQN
jgi:hypothetical protein